METIKLGTRCACANGCTVENCTTWEDVAKTPSLTHACGVRAVRLVRVRACVKDYAEKHPIQWNELTAGQRAYVLAQPNTIMETSDIPMCAPCAEYHEAKGV